MNILTDPEHLKNLLRQFKLRPKEDLGQNFLISEQVLDEIVQIAQIKKSDTIIEVGPGLGVLTQELVKKSENVLAVEKDKRFITLLKKYFRSEKNLQILEQDALRFNFENIKGDYKIVANIPYYLTSHLLQVLLALKHTPTRMVLMVQKEVAERLTATPGALSILGISVQIFADVSIEANVPKENFWPKPKVDSCIILIQPKNKFPEIRDQKLFFRILKIAFAGKRKQIHNTLANGLKLTKNEIEKLLSDSKIDSSARPQELTIEEWIRLYKAFEASQG
jgi:16S rRNA (adenine1518-N6/adenine1519-N6)-dimethyltransferase